MENLNASLVVRQAKVLDQASDHHGQILDLAFDQKGEIIALEKNYSGSFDREWSAPNLHLSLGWMDLQAEYGGPGRDDRESLDSLSAAAQAGGFTIVALSPATEPVMDRPAEVQQVLAYAKKKAVDLRPYGAASIALKGQELSEMAALIEAGALGLSHGNHAISSAAVMRLALLYAGDLGQKLRVTPCDESLREKAQMHEGSTSTQLGLRGLPVLVEILGLQRDLALADYCEASLHFCAISSAEAVALLAEAQKKRPHRAETCLLNLILNDEALKNYDSRLKVYPPLRSESDRLALWQGLRDGHLQGIASGHQARTREEKDCEFENAAFGAASLEIFFGALRAAAPADLPLEDLIEWISRQPRQLTQYRHQERIAIGERPSLSLFDPDMLWHWQDAKRQSKGANYPPVEQALPLAQLRGKALATFQHGQLHLCPKA